MSRLTSNVKRTREVHRGKSGAFFVLISEKRDNPGGPVGLCTNCCRNWITDDRWLKEVRVAYDPSRCFCYECGEAFSPIEF